MDERLQKKVRFAVTLLQEAEKSAGRFDEPVEVCYSGGKDSDVILALAKEAGIRYRAIYKATTIDPPYTIKHAKDAGAEVVRPKLTFLQLVEKGGMPTRRARMCCGHLKEYKILNVSVQGIRRAESKAREDRYREPTICRIYGSKKNCVEVFLPILEWTDKDVADFIADRGIKCHPLYYDEHGRFHVERRLGCIGCPMQSDNGVSEFKQYPKLLKQIVIRVQKFMDTHPNAKSNEKFGNAYNLVYHNLFCDSYQDYLYKTQMDLFGNVPDCKQLLEKYFNVEL